MPDAPRFPADADGFGIACVIGWLPDSSLLCGGSCPMTIVGVRAVSSYAFAALDDVEADSADAGK